MWSAAAGHVARLRLFAAAAVTAASCTALVASPVAPADCAELWGAGKRRHGQHLRAGQNLKPIHCDDGTQVIPWSCPPRSTQVERLESEEFDVLVIGGGCVGSGVALDAATRGLNVALVERNDFAAGTSGRSTKLIHGGIRYLENAFKKFDKDSLALVDEALNERAFMMRSAPFMAKPLPIMIPIYTYWEVPYMWIGAKVYDLVAGRDRQLPPSFFMSKAEALFQFPMLEADKLKGAVVYYDGQHNDTRMSLLVALTAAQKGAATVNYTEVLELTKDAEGRLNGAVVKDHLSGKTTTIKARAVVNATGPFSDGIRQMDDPAVEPMIVPSAGTHIVLPDHFSPARMGLIIPKTKDGRVLFFLPWENQTICGTTDSETELTMTPAALDEEVQFILNEANSVLNRVVRRKDVRSAWSGIRPLVKKPGTPAGSTAQLSREHVVEVSTSGLVTIAGGKWTTYRRMAEDAMDKVLQTIPGLAAGKCITSDLQILGADRKGIVVGQKFDRIVVTLREEYHFDKLTARHLVANYGTRALQVARIASEGDGALKAHLIPQHPFIEAEVVFAVQQEYAESVEDVLARRTRIAFLDGEAGHQCVTRVAELMGKEKGWAKDKVAQEVQRAQAFLDTMEPVRQVGRT